MTTENIQDNQLAKFIRGGKTTPFNYERYLLEKRWEHIKAVLQGKVIPPYEIEIQPSSICNLSCEWCVGRSIQVKRGVLRLPDQIKEEYVDEICDGIINYKVDQFKVDTIRFSGFIGEPLMNRTVTLKMIEKFTEAKIRTVLFTNGILLDTDDVREVVVKTDDIHISLDAGSAKSFSMWKCGGRTDGLALFDKILANVEEIVQLRERRGEHVRIIVGYIIHSGNFWEVLDLAQKLKGLGVNGMRFKFDISGGLSISPELKPAISFLLKKIQDELADNKFEVISTHEEEDEPTAGKVEEGGKRRFSKCLTQFLWGTIGSDGNVYPCDHLTFPGGLPYGNITKHSFKEIWEGPQRTSLTGIDIFPKVCYMCSPFSARVNPFLNCILDLAEKKGIEYVEGLRKQALATLSNSV